MSECASVSEVRLVVLGRAGAGETPTVCCSILGLQGSQAAAPTPESCRHRGEAGGRQVVVVSTPSWFGCDPEERRGCISSFLSLSSPGPHAFLLCVPVNQPADEEAKLLDVLAELFGPSAVSKHTVILFTHTEELEEDEKLEDYLATWRKDLLGLVDRCGGRYHTLESRSEGPEVGKAVEELLEKVEQAVAEGGAQHFSCPLYQRVEERIRERQEEIVRQRRRDSTDPPSEELLTEEEMEAVREEAERTIGDLDVDVDITFVPAALLAPSPAPSLLGGLWEKLMAWLMWLPTIVRREALLGALVGLFVGGPFGGMMGATVVSVATEVKRRRTQKSK